MRALGVMPRSRPRHEFSVMRQRPVDAFFLVVGFFSRFPVPAVSSTTALSDAVWMLPAAAFAIGAVPAMVMALGVVLGAAPLFAATLGVAALVVVTGALHEDGLADCADGFYGGAGRVRRLEIMRDSRIGTYGVLALVLATLGKVALLAAALESGLLTAVTLFLAAAVAGRTVALYPWIGLPNARADGLAVLAGRPSTAAFRRALLIGLAITAVLVAWRSPLGFVLASVAAILAATGVARLAQSKIGGHTGDVIGAAVVLADLSYLAAFTMWLA